MPKTKKQKVIELLKELTPKDRQAVLEIFETTSIRKTYADIEPALEKTCPKCGSIKRIKKGKNNIGLTQYECKDCGRRFNILSQTPLEKTRYQWNVWVTVLEKMLTWQSITDTHDYLIRNRIVDDIDIGTVSAMIQKLRNGFVSMPLPVLRGIIQVDEKHFRESQKGTVNLVDVLNPSSTRKAHRRATKSKYGIMGPEFSTICCAIDDSGHSIAKVVKMGHMELEEFEDDIAIHFGNVRFLCSDMNPVYTQYASIHKINQYVISSEYHKIIGKLNTPAKLQSAYEQGKLDYIVGCGIMNYKQLCKFRKENGLTINAINAYHSNLENYINHYAKGVSTKHLQSWVSFFNYQNNFKRDYGVRPTTYSDAEMILLEILKQRKPFTISDLKTRVDLTKRQSRRYTKKFIAKTVAARLKSNNPFIKFSEEDGVWVVDKRKSVQLLPEYKVRKLARALNIKPYSRKSVTVSELRKKLIDHPKLEDMLYVLAEDHFVDV